MNIEIANRLLQLRKAKNLSQEALAEKLNISRQAVSKWERAEASPDTDNLIELAKLYGITLDELLTGKSINSEADAEGAKNNSQSKNTEDEFGKEKYSQDDYAYSSGQGDSEKNKKGDYVNFKNGIHVHSANGDKVDIGLGGIHVEEKNGDKVHVGFDGIHVSENGDAKKNGRIFSRGKEGRSPLYKALYAFPYPLLALFFFVFMGVFSNAWYYSWIAFLTIPLYYSAVNALEYKNLNHFCYPVLCIVLFLSIGMLHNLWHPTWIVFLTIPLYYWIAGSINTIRCQKKYDKF